MGQSGSTNQGSRLEYPYKGNFKQMAFILYASDILGYVDIDEDASRYITKNYRFELFKIPFKKEAPFEFDF